MDYANGLKVPEGLLPSINEIAHSSLVIFFIHPDTDEDTINAHRKRLQTVYGESIRITSMITKQPIPFGVEANMLQAWKEEAIRDQVPVFCFYSYARRMARAEEQADLTFHYYPGYHCVNLQLGKIRRVVRQPHPVLSLPSLK